MDFKLFFEEKRYYVIIVLFAFLFYGNTIKNEYSFSDYYVINKQTKQGFSAIPEIFKTRYFSEHKISYGYRPITKTSFAIEFSLFGENPHVSHLINIILFGILGVLLFKTLKLVFNNVKELFLFLIVILFMAHPVQTEVVASLKNREELLMLIFGLLSIKYIFNYIDTEKWYYIILSIIMLLISYWSKPTVAVLFAIMPLLFYFSGRVNLKQGLFLVIGFAVFLFLVVRLPNLYLERQERELLFQENPLMLVDFITKVGTGFGILLFYLKKLIYPYPLSFYYGYNTIPVIGLFNITAAFSILFHFAVGLFALYKLKSRKIIYFAILSYLISIFMFSNIATRKIAGIVADRYLFIPSIFFSIIVIYFVFVLFKQSVNKDKNKSKNIKIIYVIILILIPYFFIVINRNAQWKTSEILIEHDIQYLTNSAMANEIYATNQYNLINNLKSDTEKKEALEKAIKHYKKSLEIYPEYKFSLSSLANIYFVFYKDYKVASNYYESYLKIDSANFIILKNTGFCYEKNRDYRTAIIFYKKAYAVDSNNLKINSLLANKYYYLGMKNDGDYYNNRIIKYYPSSELPQINLANYYYVHNDTSLALKYYQIALKKNPNNNQLKTLLKSYRK